MLAFFIGCENKNQLIPGIFNGFDKIVKIVINKPIQSDYFLGVDSNGINLSLTAYDNQGDTILRIGYRHIIFQGRCSERWSADCAYHPRKRMGEFNVY